MSIASHMEEASEHLAEQAKAFAAANEALKAGDSHAMMLCLVTAAFHGGRCGYRLLDAIEELEPAAKTAAKALKVTRIQ